MDTVTIIILSYVISFLIVCYMYIFDVHPYFKFKNKQKTKIILLKDTYKDWINYVAYYDNKLQCWYINLYWWAKENNSFPLKLEDNGTCTILDKNVNGYGKIWSGIIWKEIENGK